MSNKNVTLPQLQKSVFNMKNYVDNSLPEMELKYNLRESIQKTITFDDVLTSSSSAGYMITYKNFEFSKPQNIVESLKIKIQSSDNKFILESDEVLAYAFHDGSVVNVFSKTITDNENNGNINIVIYLDAERLDTDTTNGAKNYSNCSGCICVQNRTDKNKLPFDDSYNRSNIWNITIEYYDESNKYLPNYYNITNNLQNGKVGSGIQQINNTSIGDYGIALGKNNSGPGWMIGYDNITNIFEDGKRAMNLALGLSNEVSAFNNAIGFRNIVKSNVGYCLAMGSDLTIPSDMNELLCGAMIIGQGGTLSKDSSFAISTSNVTSSTNLARKNIRYPFEVKLSGDTYLRGKNIFLEAEDEIINDKSIVNKKYVDDKVASLVDSAPETLDTLKELSTALGDDPNFATTMATTLGNKVDKVDGKILSTNDLTNELKANYDAAYTHSQSAHFNGDYNSLSNIPTDLVKTSDADSKYAPIDTPNFINAISMGRISNSTIGTNSVALGSGVVASGICSFASGAGAVASGNHSFALGSSSNASGDYSHTEGAGTTASGVGSHAEGQGTTASGNCSHSEGAGTTASGEYSHAEGGGSKALNDYSHAEGYNVQTSSTYQHVQGKYNKIDSPGKYAHIVGNGTSDTARANAHTLDWSGNAWYQGDVYVGGNSQDDTNAKKLATEEYVNTKVDESKITRDQIIALNNMFRVCSYINNDISTEYEAFKNAFGIATYSVTNNLTDCINSNKATSISEYSSYNAILSVNENYVLGTPVITMGGVDITDTSYNNGIITIESVTGDITITCTATYVQTGPIIYSITNDLSNCTNSNTSTNAEEDSSYSATITPIGDCELSSITVTMNEVDITSSVVRGTTITIPSVTGNIVITAVYTRADGYVLYKQLAPEDMVCHAISNKYPYYDTRTNRISYVGRNLLIESRYQYMVEFEGNLSNVGVQQYNQNVLNAIEAGIDFINTDKNDSGWQTNGCEFTCLTDINGLPAKGIFLTFKNSSNSTVTVDSFVSCKIFRKVV